MCKLIYGGVGQTVVTRPTVVRIRLDSVCCSACGREKSAQRKNDKNRRRQNKQFGDETFKIISDLSVEIGKEPVEVNEAPGFVVNKILIPMINEGIDLVYTGVASVEGVDTAMKLGANHPMGPLALGDLIGLDVCLAIMDTLYNETHDPKYRASLLLRKMVRAGKLGRKTGIGFYDYTKK